MVSKIQAENLWMAIKDAELDLQPEPQMPDLRGLSSHTINDWLRHWRESQLGKKYKTIELDGRELLICQKTEPSLADVAARGIDMARAAVEFLDLNNKDKEKLTEIIKAYLRQMQRQKSISSAVDEVTKFHGALVSLLCKSTEIVPDTQANFWDSSIHLLSKIIPSNKPHQVFKSLCFLRDFLWQRDFVKEYCILEPLGEDEILLRHAQPLTFMPQENSSSPWSDLENQSWLKGLHKKFGNAPWFAEFIHKHKETWATLSSTPMTRVTPNPANAVRMTDIFVNSDEVTILGHHTRTAVTEPIDLADKESRQIITNWNHQQLIFPQIREQLSEFMSIWGEYYPAGPIPLTIMHQTLIGDEVVFTPDQLKAKTSKFDGSLIDSKHLANQNLRRIFEEKDFYYHPVRKQLVFILPEAKKRYIDDGFLKVEVDLLETNHCINMWQKRARVRDNDINDSRALINKAVALFQQVASQHNSEAFNTLIRFLTAPDHSYLTPYVYRGKEVKAALTKISLSIKQGRRPFTSMTRETGNALALSLQAAVELKCLVHETWGGSARRNITNWSRDNLRKWYFGGLGHVVDFGTRLTLSVLSFFVKIPVCIPHLIYLYKHWYDRETVYLGLYEGVLAENIGMLEGGCVSAVDRAGEMAEFRAALKKQFMRIGRIIGFNDSHKEKLAFRETYGNTNAKHIQAEMATAVAGTKEKEMNFFADILIGKTENKKERSVSNHLAKLRIGSFENISYDDYLWERSSSQHRTIGSRLTPVHRDFQQIAARSQQLEVEEGQAEMKVWAL